MSECDEIINHIKSVYGSAFFVCYYLINKICTFLCFLIKKMEETQPLLK